MICPICDRETDPEYRPFCSKRCADVDLGRWLTGRYAIPLDEAEEDEDASPTSSNDATGPH
jgi:uncharacterized protein